MADIPIPDNLYRTMGASFAPYTGQTSTKQLFIKAIYSASPYSALLSLSELQPYTLRWFCTYCSTIISSGSLPTVATK